MNDTTTNDAVESKICNFCGKTINESNIFTSFTSGLSICSTCVTSCYGSIKDRKNLQNDIKINTNIADAEDLKSILDDYVIGQENAKRDLALAVSYHMWRKNSSDTKKMNLLLMGPTGTGKTYMVETLLEKMHIPYVVADATVMSSTGYVGADPDDTIRDLTSKIESGFSVDEIKRGVVVIDEVDKIRKSSSNMDKLGVTNVSVQQELLKLMEGRIVDLRKKQFMSNSMSNFPGSTFDTRDVLFIFMGAFTDLYKNREDKQRYLPMFVRQNIVSSQQLVEKDEIFLEDEIISSGMIAEFVGRLSILSQLHDLTKSDLNQILIGTARPVINEFQTYFREKANIDLSFTTEGIEEIVKQAFDRKLGARGLRTYILRTLLGNMFSIATLKKRNITSLQVTLQNGKVAVIEC